jgi:hypothetical protein
MLRPASERVPLALGILAGSNVIQSVPGHLFHRAAWSASRAALIFSDDRQNKGGCMKASNPQQARFAAHSQQAQQALHCAEQETEKGAQSMSPGLHSLCPYG